MSETPLQIRWMIRRDMPSVLEIEQASFDHTWTEEAFLAQLRQRTVVGMVAEEHTGEIVSFMIYELHKGSFEILNFAVHPSDRLEGVGTAMIDRLKGKMSQQRRREVFLSICENNLDAQLFFKCQGFTATSVLREFYNTGEDAYVFSYQLERGENEFAPGLSPSNRVSKHFEDAEGNC